MNYMLKISQQYQMNITYTYTTILSCPTNLAVYEKLSYRSIRTPTCLDNRKTKLNEHVCRREGATDVSTKEHSLSANCSKTLSV